MAKQAEPIPSAGCSSRSPRPSVPLFLDHTTTFRWMEEQMAARRHAERPPSLDLGAPQRGEPPPRSQSAGDPHLRFDQRTPCVLLGGSRPSSSAGLLQLDSNSQRPMTPYARQASAMPSWPNYSDANEPGPRRQASLRRDCSTGAAASPLPGPHLWLRRELESIAAAGDPLRPWALAGSLGIGAGRCHDGAHGRWQMGDALAGASTNGGERHTSSIFDF